jgi:hypothetical protein
MRILRHLYDPKRYYERLMQTVASLKPAYKHRPGTREALTLAFAFFKLCGKAGTARRTTFLYWRALFTILMTNRRALGAAISLAALYMDLSQQSQFVIGLLEEEVAYVDSIGEERYIEMARERGHRAEIA